MTAAFTPATRLAGLKPYKPSSSQNPSARRMHANEGVMPASVDLPAALAELDLAIYPNASTLEAKLAEVHGVAPDRVVVTAGADDALFRLAFVALEPGRKAAIFEPTFEMVPRYVQLSGGTAVGVPWLDGPFPEEAFGAALEADGVCAGFLVTPSSPAGEVAPIEAIERLADRARAKGVLLVVDLAYVELADEDPTERLAARGDVVITRTFSKAVGLAGVRVGYALCPEPVADALRTVGQPFNVCAPSLALAEAILPRRPEISAASRDRVRSERARLTDKLAALGARPIESQANFVLARLGDRATQIAASLDASGFRIRVFSQPGLEGMARISCPQDETVFVKFLDALDAAFSEGYS